MKDDEWKMENTRMLLVRKFLIVGAARAVVLPARTLARRGAIVALNDQKPIEEWTEEALALLPKTLA
jgi:hypothetical protein